MRQGRLVASRLVATGLAAGVLAGYLTALLRPRRAARAQPQVDLTGPDRARTGPASSISEAGVGPVRSASGTPYTDAVTLAMAARGLTADRFTVARDGEVLG